MSKQIESSLSSLLPTLSPLPVSLLELATSLLAQSKFKASSLKQEEEIARTYACCHIACERLGKNLALEIGKPMPPCPPKVYTRLKTYLGTTLRTPANTPRGTRVEDKVTFPETRTTGIKYRTPTSERGGSRKTPVKRALDLKETPAKRAKRDGARSVTTSDHVDVIEQTTEEALLSERSNVENNHLIPIELPSKTPLRRKEKHASRPNGPEDPGAAGLLPGLGTMFQPAVDWLSEERQTEYMQWEKNVHHEIARIEQLEA